MNLREAEKIRMNRASSLSTSTNTKYEFNVSNNNSSQFKNTALWKNIIENLKKSLLEDSNVTTLYHNRLKKQHSKFIAASVGGMLIIKQNLLNINNNSCLQNGKCLEDICFTGSQCVDIVFNYLTSKEQKINFETEVTREKVCKLIQTIMNSGVLESVNRNITKFDDTLLKFYRFKQSDDICDKEYIRYNQDEHKEECISIQQAIKVSNDENFNSENQHFNKNYVGFNKTKKTALTSNTKLKRKLNSMRRSSTIHALLPVENNSNESDSSSRIQDENKLEKKKIEQEILCKDQIDSNTLEQDEKKILNHNYSISKSESLKLAQDLYLTRQITRELIIEKLLSLIDLPVIEHLLVVDERNDIEYCELMNLTQSKHSNVKEPSKSLAKCTLSILTQNFDFSKCNQEEWKKAAFDCLKFLEWEKLWQQQISLKTEKASIINNMYTTSQTPVKPSKTNSKELNLIFMNDIEMYNLIKDFYTIKRVCFLDDSFQPLFSHILNFLRHSHYNKAIETLNFGTLLLLRQTQAELKRLLKFLYLTANCTQVPRLSQTKPNNSILLNHFACCLFNMKLIGFEESRLILNFMLSNFDHLFKINKTIQESIFRRFNLKQNYGHEEALLEKLYCKKLTNKELQSQSKNATTKALVDLINHIVDDPQISLKQKKLKLKALQRIHPEIYEKYFSDLF